MMNQPEENRACLLVQTEYTGELAGLIRRCFIQISGLTVQISVLIADNLIHTSSKSDDFRGTLFTI